MHLKCAYDRCWYHDESYWLWPPVLYYESSTRQGDYRHDELVQTWRLASLSVFLLIWPTVQEAIRLIVYAKVDNWSFRHLIHPDWRGLEVSLADKWPLHFCYMSLAPLLSAEEYLQGWGAPWTEISDIGCRSYWLKFWDGFLNSGYLLFFKHLNAGSFKDGIM